MAGGASCALPQIAAAGQRTLQDSRAHLMPADCSISRRRRFRCAWTGQQGNVRSMPAAALQLPGGPRYYQRSLL